MSRITKNLNITLNGKKDFKIEGDTYSWNGGTWMGYVDIWSPDVGKTYKVNINFASDDWDAGSIRVSGQATLNTTIDGSRAGPDIFIEHIRLADGTNTVNLGTVAVNFVRGGRGNDAITLGSGNVDAVSTREGDDTVITGSGFVGSVQLGNGNNTVKTADRFVQGILAFEGDDTAEIGAGGAGTVKLDSGNNVIKTTSGHVDWIDAHDGNDRATIGSGGATSVNLGHGNNVVVTGAGWVDSIIARDGNDRATIGAEGAGLVNLGHGNNTVKLGKGWVDAVVTRNGNDKVTTGPGGFGSVNVGGGDDTVILAPLDEAGWLGVALGGFGTDTVNFSPFKRGLTIKLWSADYIDTGSGYFIISSFENAIGTARSDVIEGDQQDNVINGGKGADDIAGLAGADTLTGGGGGDRFILYKVEDSTPGAGSQDIIKDFKRKQKDKIDLSWIDANSSTADNDDFSFIGRKALSGKAGELRFEKVGKKTFIYGDVDGDAVADLAIQLDNGVNVGKADFVL